MCSPAASEYEKISGRTDSVGTPRLKNIWLDWRLPFFFDAHFDFCGHVAEYLYRHGKLTDSLQGFTKLGLALVNLEALCCEPFRDISGSDRAEHLIVLARLSLELQRNAIQQLGLFLGRFHLRRRFLRQRSPNALDDFQVSSGCLDSEFFRQQKIAGIAGLHRDNVTAVAQLFDVFLKNNLHECSLGSSSVRPLALLRLQLAQPQRVQPRLV